MKSGKLSLGQAGEELASRFLAGLGYRLLARNYRTRLGEIDIVAEEGRVVVFVEVKTRRAHQCGHPAEAVTPAKCRQISKAALQYLGETGREGQDARFDVVAVTIPADSSPEIELIRNAFDLSYGV
ncbi:YraN family protein [Thiovibrio sp. JS02]